MRFVKYGSYKKRKKQKKYSEFKSGTKLFSEKQIEIIKNRIRRAHAILEMEVGAYNAKRLLTYPCINNGITHKGACACCKEKKDLIRFDNDTSLCKKCAYHYSLI